MFDHLLDPDPPDIDDAFRRRVVALGRRRQRRVRIAAGGTVLGPLVAFGGLTLYVRSQVDELDRISVDGLTPVDDEFTDHQTSSPTSTSAGDDVERPPLSEPVHVLVVGVDRRPAGSDVVGSRADAIVLVRLDPTDPAVNLLSLPRDLWVTAPDGTQGRLNSFSGDGGLVGAVASLLDVEINHYIEVDFDGFRSLIDIAGGVAIPFEHPVRDTSTGFAVEAGCHRLSGDDALAYVRSRRLQTLDPSTGVWTTDARGDLGRIVRQQDVVQRLFSTVLSTTYGTSDKVRILNDVLDDLTVDRGLDLDGLRTIFDTAATIGLDGLDVFDFTDGLDGAVIDGRSVLVAETAVVEATVRDWLGDGADATSGVGSVPSTDAPRTAAC